MDVWKGRIGRWRSRKVLFGFVRVMGEEIMWIMVLSVVVLVVVFVVFVVFGGYLFLMGVDNEVCGEVRKLEKIFFMR